eukprot:CAMPEP_0118902770 /NCGR_PEP_ID=MMETSP1166-20130328/7915_1 /TAXON_ID=1104430 /ORGANISM="Chrysoreinhardia sp, Strain CCMP3193" /LENGTH=226 /DNA_ID=CAMNT_0006841985 /DNA_START=97 /DNA_END=774 /DNA_ORIENTATION=-
MASRRVIAAPARRTYVSQLVGGGEVGEEDGGDDDEEEEEGEEGDDAGFVVGVVHGDEAAGGPLPLLALRFDASLVPLGLERRLAREGFMEIAVVAAEELASSSRGGAFRSGRRGGASTSGSLVVVSRVDTCVRHRHDTGAVRVLSRAVKNKLLLFRSSSAGPMGLIFVAFFDSERTVHGGSVVVVVDNGVRALTALAVVAVVVDDDSSSDGGRRAPAARRFTKSSG